MKRVADAGRRPGRPVVPVKAKPVHYAQIEEDTSGALEYRCTVATGS
jgi:hypothetical protein